MSTVRTVVHPGWLAVSGPEVDAVVEAADRHTESLEAAAADGLVALLEALTAHGLSSAPGFVACAPTPTGLRVVARGAACFVLPDGTRVDARGRMPWLDVDLDLGVADQGEVVLEAPRPQPARGWRRPARLSRPAEAAPAAPPPPVPTPTELLPVVDLDAPTHVVPEPGTGEDAEQPVPPSGQETLEVPGPAPQHPTPDVTTDLDRPVVLAVLCPAGHPSPPHAGSCRTCGAAIPPQQPFPMPRPSLGVLRMSTGGSVPLDRGVLLGRAPRVNEELPANQRPHLVRVGGPDRDISRNHAEIVLEGWHVLVRDLGSTNGTTVTLPGQEPVRLRPTEDQGIEPGTVVTLADEVVLTYEVQE